MAVEDLLPHPSCPPSILDEFPAEILLDIIAYLDVQDILALAYTTPQLSRFINDPWSWRGAFVRVFGPVFTRLSKNATWASEFVVRSRLLQALKKNRGAGHCIEGSDGHGRRHTKPGKAVDTIVSWRPRSSYPVTHLSAIWRPDSIRILHGADVSLECGMSDGVRASVIDWLAGAPAVETPAPPLDEWLWGQADGPAKCLGATDLSELFGAVQASGTSDVLLIRGRHYRQPRRFFRVTPTPDDLKINGVYNVPEHRRAYSAAWMAKAPEIMATTNSQVTCLVGGVMGDILAFTTHPCENPHRNGADQLTCSWMVSPGVPIVAIEVDSQYNGKRALSRRIWAVALNALGEVFYLSRPPSEVIVREPCSASGAWVRGAKLPWVAVPCTLRKVRDDISNEFTTVANRARNMVSTPGSHATQRSLVDNLMHRNPRWFIEVFRDWDMRRKLVVDFGAEATLHKGEQVVVINAGHGSSVSMIRHTRLADPDTGEDQWFATKFDTQGMYQDVITAIALDTSPCALSTLSEDVDSYWFQPNENLGQFHSDLERRRPPGNRARFLVIGTRGQTVAVYNIRDRPSSDTRLLAPINRFTSPLAPVSAVAINALYLAVGGSDGSLNIWDIFKPADEPLRIISPPFKHGQVDADWRAVNSIFLDPDVTAMRGVTSIAHHLRHWHFAGPPCKALSKRRATNASAASGRTVKQFIRNEQAELIRDETERVKEMARKNKRFGDISNDDEALQYAMLLSLEHKSSDGASNGTGIPGTGPVEPRDEEQVLIEQLHIADEAQRLARAALGDVGLGDSYTDEEYQALVEDYKKIVADTLMKDMITGTSMGTSMGTSSSPTPASSLSISASSGSVSTGALGETAYNSSSYTLDTFEDDLQLALQLSLEDEGSPSIYISI